MDASGPIVPWTGDPALVCAACSATSDKVPWARVSVTRAADGTVVRRTPIGSGCRECAEAALEAHLPNTLDWDTAVSDTATKEAIPNYVKLRRGEPSIFTKNSATALIRYSTTWQEEAEPVDVAELKLKYSSELLLRCGAQVDVLPDARGNMREVILCPTGARPRVLLNTTVEYVHTVHHLRPETHLRPKQGEEFQEKMKALAQQQCSRHPAANGATKEDLIQKLESLAQSGPGLQRAHVPMEPFDERKAGVGGEVTTEEGIGVASQPAGVGSQPAEANLVAGAKKARNTNAQKAGTDHPQKAGTDRPPAKRKSIEQDTFSNDGGKKRSKGLQDFTSLTISGMLCGNYRNPRETLYHQRQRMAGLKRSMDRISFDEEETKLRELSAAERLCPVSLPTLSDEELKANLSIVFGAGEMPAQLPDEFVKGLLRRKVLGSIDKASEVFDAVWIFSTAQTFDPFAPRLADAPVSMEVKLDWMRLWIFNEYLGEHMNKDEKGVVLVRALVCRVLREGTLEPPIPSDDVAAKTIWTDIYSSCTALGAVVQKEAVTPQQMESLSQCDMEHPKTPAQKVLSNMFRRVWWGEQLKETWRHGSTEALAQPRLERIAGTLRSAKSSDKDTDDAWTMAQKNMEKWQKTLRHDSLNDVFCAMMEHMKGQSQKITNMTLGSEHLPFLETLRSRMRWLEDTARVTSLTPEMKVLHALIQGTSARAKVSHGLNVIADFCRAEGDDQGVLDLMAAAFEECRGLKVGAAEATAVLAGVQRICEMTEVARKHIQLASDMLSLIPASSLPDGGEVEASEDEGGLETVGEAGLTAAGEAGLTAAGRLAISTLDNRFARTLAGWDVLAKVSDKRGERYTVADVAETMVVLQSWDKSPAEVRCVPDAFVSEVDVAVERLREDLREHGRSTVDQAEVSLKELLPKLEEMAHGKRNGSWKETLTEESPWDDVLREATYHLLSGGEEGPIKDRLTPLYTETQKAYQQYTSAIDRCSSIDTQAACSIDEGLAQRCGDAMATALLTTTEAYMVEQLTSSPGVKLAGKLRARIASMVKKEIDPSKIQEAIWAKVQQVVG